MPKKMQMSFEVYKQHDEHGNAEHLLSPEDKEKVDEGDFTRAGGDSICPVCDMPYFSHPNVVGALWLTKLCDGRLVKL